MNKILIALVLAVASAAFADEKVWPSDYWTVVTNQMTAAKPTGTATATQTQAVTTSVETVVSAASQQQMDARYLLFYAAGNYVSDFDSRLPGGVVIIR